MLARVRVRVSRALGTLTLIVWAVRVRVLFMELFDAQAYLLST